MDTSRVWSKPELIVLGRGAPEENVLSVCKTRPSFSCGSSRCAHKQGNCFVQNSRYHTS
jgi:hypothetical protein